MSDKNKTYYICSTCAYESAKWFGRCPGCGEWNTMSEETRAVVPEKKIKRVSSLTGGESSRPTRVKDIAFTTEERLKIGLSELDRVFGGGIVKGSVSLIGGEPGIGKSTLLLQICEYLKDYKILYVSGEESLSQLKMRAKRLKVDSDNLYMLTQTEIDKIVENIQEISPDVVIIDSIQTIYSQEISSIPGSISQIKESALRLTELSKSSNITTLIVGHINKDGAIAGPKVLEHMVDVVLYFEGDNNISCRILRAAKNRYGSTNEIGMFDMCNDGLMQIENPSAMLLQGRPENVSGTCAVSVMEGTRPILAEIQALLVQTGYGVPRRTATGIDQNRVAMLLAVLEKRAGLRVSSCDVFANVIGGLRMTDTSSDLAVTLSMASSFLNKPIPNDFVAIGEIGLAGEIRSVSFIENRIAEARRLGLNKFIIPSHSKLLHTPDDVEIFPVKNISQAIETAL